MCATYFLVFLELIVFFITIYANLMLNSYYSTTESCESFSDVTTVFFFKSVRNPIQSVHSVIFILKEYTYKTFELKFLQTNALQTFSYLDFRWQYCFDLPTGLSRATPTTKGQMHWRHIPAHAQVNQGRRISNNER